MSSTTVPSLLPRPAWLFFLLLGLALHSAIGYLFPPPLPQLGPPDPLRIAARAEHFATLAGRPATDAERAEFARRELHDELLFREALRQGLHRSDSAVTQRLVRNLRFLQPDTPLDDDALVAQALALNLHLSDEVVRRRLIQSMAALIRDAANIPAISESALLGAYREQSAQLTAPARLSFRQHFLGEVSADAATEQLLRLREQRIGPDAGSAAGQPFLWGHRFEGMTWVQISARFGQGFVRRLRALLEGSVSTNEGWQGPLQSTFGQHLIWIDTLTPSRQLSFEEARPHLLQRLRDAQQAAALQVAIDKLMQDYRVVSS